MLYGRDAECARLGQLLAAAQQGTSGVLFLHGAAGVGKSTLLTWLEERSEHQGMRVLRCGGLESESGMPFATLHQLLRPVLPGVARLADSQRRAVEGALGLSAGREVDPFMVAVGVLSLLDEVVGDDGLTCIVDDAQWMDQASLDAVTFVARRLRAEGIALVLAARASGDWAGLRTSGLPLMPILGIDEPAADLLTQRLAPYSRSDVRARLVIHTAGNPLALLELVSALAPDQLSGRQPLPDPLPLSAEIEQFYAARIAALPTDVQQFLLLAAASDTTSLTTITQAARHLGLLDGRLDEAITSGFITVAQGAVAFKHPLVRSAIYARASRAERQLCHQALASQLSPAVDSDRRAWHLARATTGTDDRLAEMLDLSADRALKRGGAAAAADRWERSAELSSRPADQCRRLIEAADNAFRAAQPERARAMISRASLVTDTPTQRFQAQALLGAIELRHGYPEAAYTVLLHAAEDIAEQEPIGALKTLVAAGEAAAFIGDPRMTLQVGQVAARLQDSPLAQTPEARSMISLTIGLSKLFEGDWGAGARLLSGVAETGVGTNDYDQALQAGRATMYLGQLTEAREIYVTAVAEARATGAGGLLSTMLDRLAYIEVLLGRISEAESHATEGLSLASDLGLDSGVALSSLALVSAYKGQTEQCTRRATQAHQLATTRHLRMIAAGADWALGVSELGDGRPTEALRYLTAVASELTGHPGILRWATPDLIEAAVRAGNPEAGEPALSRLRAWAQASDLPIPNAALSRCLGLLADGDEAIEHYEAALDHDAACSRPLERARIELLLGESLRRQRQRSRARIHLRNAMQTFERLSAHPWADRARVELRASGESTVRRDQSSAEHLTPQELQIAVYAAEGASNVEIAAKLFLSRRTVEYHLSKVFTKLGITSRRDLALADLGGHHD